MPRRRYYRYPRRTVAKKKWATNYKTLTVMNGSGNQPFTILAENKAQADAPTPTIIKTGNFKVQADVVVSTQASVPSPSLKVYILFVPEGWSDASITIIPNTHPEWIMGWSVVDLPYLTSSSYPAGNKFSITSRLKRNLNSGDKVVFYFDTTIPSTASVTIHGAAQFWTCAN